MEVVQALYQALDRHDTEAWLDLLVPDVEIVSGLLPDQPLVRGHEGVKRYRAALREVWGDSIRIRPEEVIDHEERVVAIVRIESTGLSSGVALDSPVVHVFAFRDGKITRLETFASRSEALQPVGLRE